MIRKLLVAVFLTVLLCRTCKALDDGHHKFDLQGCVSDCVSSPFRLQDSAEECGDRRYNLSCEQNQLVMNWESGRYIVLSIDYENYTIRVRDANIVESDSSNSLPEHSLTGYNFSLSDAPYASGIAIDEDGVEQWYLLNKDMIYVRCEHPVDSPGFVDAAPCFRTSSASYWYVYVGNGSVGEVGLEDECRVEGMYMTSWPAALNKNPYYGSCTDIQRMFVYGFELSWLNTLCTNSRGYAIFRFHKGNKQPVCIDSGSGYIHFPDILWNILVYAAVVGIPLALYTGAKFVLGAPFVIALLIYKWRRRHLSMYESIEDFLQSDNNSIIPIRYSYKDIKKITDGFKIKLGKGGYGSVFKGQLRSGRDVAVKMLDKSNANGQDFINEVATLGRIHHVNVVHLIGYCVEGSKRALVYEFMQNGSLDKYILSKPNHDERSLNLHQLYAISLGIARGIEYLHKGCDMQILHFDIKPHNILLDDNFIPKVSDFGLAKLYPTDDSIVSLTAARGTIGYMAPELFYQNVGGISYKADIYSFGMLLMEIAGRRKNLNVLTEHSSQFYFPFWAHDKLNEGNEIKIEDATEEEMKVARKMMIVGLWCIQTKPCDRPSMNKVMEMLEGDEKDLELPQKPYIYPQDLPTVDDSDNSSSTHRSESESISHPPVNNAVEILEVELQELVFPQKSFPDAQDSPVIDVNLMPPSMKNSKETTSFLNKQDERSI